MMENEGVSFEYRKTWSTDVLTEPPTARFRSWKLHQCEKQGKQFHIAPNNQISNYQFFLSWLAAKSFITYLTLESFIPTSMLSIIILTMRLGVTLNVSEVPYVRIDTATWRHFPRHLVWFSHAFPLDSFSRTARTRSHVQC